MFDSFVVYIGIKALPDCLIKNLAKIGVIIAK